MTLPTLTSLLQNAALLLAMAVLVDTLTSRVRISDRPLGQGLLGALLGALGIGLLLASLRVEPDLLFDTRSVLLAVTGLIFGAIPTAVAMVMTAAYRIYQGGTGTWTGVAVILASGGLGLAWRRVRRRPLADLSGWELYAFGGVVHLMMLALLLTLPWALVRPVLARLGLLVLLVYPLATVAFGLLAVARLRREGNAAELIENEARYRSLFENNHAMMLLVDPNGGIVDANPAACRFYGWTRDQLLQMRMAQINTLPAEEIQARLHSANVHQGQQFLFIHRTADGSLREVEVVSGPITIQGRLLLYSISHDVTERRQVESALREQKQLLAESQRMGRIGSWVIHLDGRIFWSDEMYRVYGVAPDTFIPTVKSFYGLVHPEDHPALQGWFAACRAGKNPEELVFRITRPDGTIRFISGRGNLHLDAGNQPDYLAGTGQDITERTQSEAALRRVIAEQGESRRALLSVVEDQKRTEEAVRRSEQAYRFLFAANPHPMWIYDLESLRFLAINGAAVGHYGFSEEEFLGMDLWDICPPEAIPSLLEEARKAIGELRESGTWRHRKKNGDLMLVEIKSHAVEWEGRAARVVVAHDVTLRERIRQDLLASEASLMAAFDQAMVGMAHVSPEGRILKANGRFGEILGRTPSDLDGVDLNGIIHPEEQLAPGVSLGEVLARMNGNLTQEMRYLSPDGSAIWVQRFDTLVNAGPGHSPYILQIAEDVSDRKRLEMDIKALNRGLEQRVEQRTQQLESANQELEAFAYSVSHDLRAPLRTISGFAEALIRDADSSLSPAGRGHLQRIQGGTVRMAQLIEDLLGLSRIGQNDFTAIPLDLRRLADRILAGLQAADPGRTVTCQVELPHRLLGDPRLLRILLENLLGNAWKFTAHTPDARIAITSRVTGPAGVEISIRDNGAGFPSAQAGKLFTPFQRLHKAEAFPGTGIGLAIAKRIVSRHGGVIRAEGELGRGAAIHFTLPRAKEDPT